MISYLYKQDTRYLYTDVLKISGISAELQQINATGFDN